MMKKTCGNKKKNTCKNSLYVEKTVKAIVWPGQVKCHVKVHVCKCLKNRGYILFTCELHVT